MFPWHALRDATQVPVLVDGAQSVGAIEVDATGADFYTVSAQKWLCGPDATGALFVADPETLPPRLVAYPSAETYDIAEATWEPKAGARRFDTAFTPPTSLAGLEAALSRPAGRAVRACARAGRALPQAAARPGPRRRHRGGSGDARLVRATTGDTGRGGAALYERGVIMRELPGTGLLRASVGWWNDGSDLERLAEGLEELGSAALAAQAELAGDRLQRGDHVRDVLVEVELEELGAFVDVVARDARRERRLLQLLLDGLRLEAVEARRADEPARVHEPRELVACEQRPLERRVARHREVVAWDRIASITSSG